MRYKELGVLQEHLTKMRAMIVRAAQAAYRLGAQMQEPVISKRYRFCMMEKPKQV